MKIQVAVQTYLQNCYVKIDLSREEYDKLTEQEKINLLSPKIYGGEFEYDMDIQDFDLLD